ncbi:MAG: helix-turn-helix domain-containing protein, partial [Firmicutes bacterium]|nr:helix-turn-helix domain-containing protein [Bacillota bacterium]
VEIRKDLLLELCFTNKLFLQCFLQFISDTSLLLGDKIKHYLNRSIRESLINFLNYEYKKQNTLQIKLGFTKKALAEKIGVQRTSLSRELQKMKNEGLVQFDAESITILDQSILD